MEHRADAGARVAMLFALLLPACPGQKIEPPKATCTKVGESCMSAPGKLGLCVEPVNDGALIANPSTDGRGSTKRKRISASASLRP